MDAALQRLVSGDGMTREDLALFQLILNDGGSESGAALALAGELTRTGAALEIARGRQQLAPRAPNPPLSRLRRLRRGCEGGFAAPLPAALAPPIRAPVSPAAAPPFRHPQERRVPRSVPIAAAQEARSRARRTAATAPSFHRTAHSEGRSARHAQVSRRPSPPRSAPRPACRLPREATSRRRSVESCPQSACFQRGR